jgi:hypothetical protein
VVVVVMPYRFRAQYFFRRTVYFSHLLSFAFFFAAIDNKQSTICIERGVLWPHFSIIKNRC